MQVQVQNTRQEGREGGKEQTTIPNQREGEGGGESQPSLPRRLRIGYFAATISSLLAPSSDTTMPSTSTTSSRQDRQSITHTHSLSHIHIHIHTYILSHNFKIINVAGTLDLSKTTPRTDISTSCHNKSSSQRRDVQWPSTSFGPLDVATCGKCVFLPPLDSCYPVLGRLEACVHPCGPRPAKDIARVQSRS